MSTTDCVVVPFPRASTHREGLQRITLAELRRKLSLGTRWLVDGRMLTVVEQRSSDIVLRCPNGTNFYCELKGSYAFFEPGLGALVVRQKPGTTYAMLPAPPAKQPPEIPSESASNLVPFRPRRPHLKLVASTDGA